MCSITGLQHNISHGTVQCQIIQPDYAHRATVLLVWQLLSKCLAAHMHVNFLQLHLTKAKYWCQFL